jgi:chemotaxis protein methyltransferase CheR
VRAARDLPGPFVAEAAALVRRRTGLVIGETRGDVFADALADAMRAADVSEPAVYLANLAATPALLDDLVGVVTVGETYFFRDPGQFAVLRERVLPELLARTDGNRPLRIWSAGCASGEEPYSIAMLLDQLGALDRAWILGTDISRPALARARRGRYDRWSFRGVEDRVVARYFTRTGSRYHLVPRLRQAVEFRYLNLADASYPSATTGMSSLDLVVCRNVLIYFDGETIRRVTAQLVAALAPDGWLLLGASDPVIGGVSGCEVVMTTAGLAYRRAEARPAVPPLTSTWPEVATEAAAPRPKLVLPALDPPRAPPAPSRSQAARALAAVGPPDRDGVIEVRSLAARGKLADAERACVRALERDGLSAELHVLHAQLLTEAREYEAAAVAARRALYLDRGLAVAHLALGAALAGKGDRRGARRAFGAAERLLADAPESAVVPASGGEPAGRLLELARAELALLADRVA